MNRTRHKKTKMKLFIRLVNEPDLNILANEFDSACDETLADAPKEKRRVLTELRAELGPILRAIAKDASTARELAYWIQITRTSKIDVDADTLTLSVELGDPPTEGSAIEFAYINLIIEDLWATFTNRRIDLLKICTVCSDLYLLGRYSEDPKYCSDKCGDKADHRRHRKERLEKQIQYQKFGATHFIRCTKCRSIIIMPDTDSGQPLMEYKQCPECGERNDIRDITPPDERD